MGIVRASGASPRHPARRAAPCRIRTTRCGAAAREPILPGRLNSSVPPRPRASSS